jgi:hypothetical protein
MSLTKHAPAMGTVARGNHRAAQNDEREPGDLSPADWLEIDRHFGIARNDHPVAEVRTALPAQCFLPPLPWSVREARRAAERARLAAPVAFTASYSPRLDAREQPAIRSMTITDYGLGVRRVKCGDTITCEQLVDGQWQVFHRTDEWDDLAYTDTDARCRAAVDQRMQVA